MHSQCEFPTGRRTKGHSFRNGIHRLEKRTGDMSKIITDGNIGKAVKRIYLSGAITAIGVTRAKEIFGRAKEDLEKRGFEVVTPFENGLPDEAPYEDHMSADMKMLEECDTVCMLPGWWMSKGAKREYKRAEELGKTLITYRKIRK